MKKIAKKIDSYGPMNFQFKSVNGKIYLFEINARFSTTSYVRSLSGYNEPLMILNDLVYKNYKPKIKFKNLLALAHLDYRIFYNVSKL